VQLLQYCYITVLWIQIFTAVLLVQGRVEIAAMLAVNALQLHYSATDTGTEGTDIFLEKRCNFDYACSYCSNITSK